jgi:hypothetical protein
MLALISAGMSLAAPVAHKTGTAAKHAAPAKKVDPTLVLVANVALNSVKPDADLYKACKAAKFQNLAYALQGVKGLSATRTEFETQAQFDERTAKLTDAINGSGSIIICQYLNDNEDVSFRYDADRQQFSGSFDPDLAAWRNIRQVGSYVSKTRMGVRATVRSSVDIEYMADMTDTLRSTRVSCLRGGYGDVSFQFPVPQADAELLKLTGYLVILGRIVPPYYSESDTAGAPTLDDPTDVFTRKMSVPFQPSEIAVIDFQGKKVWDCPLQS